MSSGRIATIVVGLLLSAALACRKPPAGTDDAALPPFDASVGDPDAEPLPFDATVSDCLALPDLTCEAIQARVDGEFSVGTDQGIEAVRGELAPVFAVLDEQLCGEADGEVHYLGEDSQVHQAVQANLPTWTPGPVQFDPGGRPCATLQDFEQGGVILRVRTWRAQRSFSFQLRSEP